MGYRFLGWMLVAVSLLSWAGCGSSGSSGGSSTSTTTTGGGSDAVPTDVALASPTAATSASSSISVGKGVFKATGDPTTDSYADKKAAREALAAGTGECSFTPSLTIPTSPACYGPIIRFTNHSDGSSSQPTLPPFDTGFWNLTEGASSEACAAAQMNSLVELVASRVDMMFNMFDMMVCVGKKGGLSLPTTAGTTTDYKTALSSHGSAGGITVNTAQVERLANDSSGNTGYKSTVSVTIVTGSETRTGTAILKNIVTGTDANGKNNYKGKLSMSMSNPTAIGAGNNCSGAADSGSVMAAVVKYVKTSATSVKYEVDFGEFCSSTASPLDSSNNIVRTDVFNSSTNPDGWGSNYNFGLFDINPSNGTGTVAYAWQAGFGDQRTRVLNVNTSLNTDGSGSGTAWYGFGPDVNGTGTLGSIDGFICNWAGPNGATSASGNNRSQTALAALTPPRAVEKAQKQVLSRAKGGTVFTTTAANSKITYAVANSCDKTSSNPTFTFVAETMTGTVLSHTNNISDATTVTNNLVAIPTSTDFARPSSVEDVGS